MTTSLATRELRALRVIRDWIARGRAPSVRQLQLELGYRSPRSAAQILETLIGAGYLRRRNDGKLQFLRDAADEAGHARTVQVPLVGDVPCGNPLLAEENVEALIPVSTRLARPPHRYFLLRARGDSMDLAGIHNGDIVLVRQQPTAMDGDKVVALIDDEVTLKEFRRQSQLVALMPRSSNKAHKPILLSDDFQVQGLVVANVPSFDME